MKSIILTAIASLCFLMGTAQSETIETKVNDKEIFTVVEENAEYQGGMTELSKFIQTNLHYPDSARNNKIGGTCYIKFIIGEDGKVTNVEALKGVTNCPECDKEAIRVIELMPAWIPAKIKGMPVKCYYNLPIKYKA